MAARHGILFVTTLASGGWGGSEELWSRTALALSSEGLPVTASVLDQSPCHPRVVDLMARGIDVRPYHWTYPLSRQPFRRFASRRTGGLVYAIDRVISAKHPSLVVVSDGGILPPVHSLELLAARKVPFVTISHANSVEWWPPDDVAARYRAVLRNAAACFFVSHANLRLTEEQIGCPIQRAEIVRNPVNVTVTTLPPWPTVPEKDGLRLACVGRLHPPSKGQDILLQVLARPEWKTRPWRLNLYGEGPMRQTLGRLADKLDLSARVTFAGFVPADEIWTTNHALVMPSRYEGLPLAMVEAMLCGRPVIATDVAGHKEVVTDGVTGFLADAPTVQCLSMALERFWQRRHEAAEMGAAGRRLIRQLMPSDPISEFSNKLKALAGSTQMPGDDVARQAYTNVLPTEPQLPDR